MAGFDIPALRRTAVVGLSEMILTENRKVLDVIAEKLIEVENLERKEFEELLIANGITPKKKKEEDTIA